MGDPPPSGPRLPSPGAFAASLPPGLGHLRARRWGQGLVLLAASLFFTAVAAHPAHYALPPPSWGLASAGLAVFALFWLYAARDLDRHPAPGAGRGREVTGRPSAASRRGRGRGSR